MKKIFLFFISFFTISLNVYACGELKSISVEGATVKPSTDMTYLVRLNSPKDKVMLEVQSDYDFLNGYGSRIVSTKEDALVKVDGYKCGFGIYTYTISFDIVSNTIAENTTDEEIKEEDKKEEDLKPGLQNIEIEGYEIDFSQEKKKYTIEVPNDVTSIKIVTKTSEGYTAAVSDKAKNLTSGENLIRIMVVDQEDNITTYEILAVKEANKSNNNYLASLQITGYPLNFDSNITNYSLNIPSNVSVLEITAITEESKAQFTVNGNNNLQNGSVITITVTAEDGTTKDYTITIIKKLDIMDIINQYKIYIVISLLIILLLILVIRNKKKKKAKPIAPEKIDVPVTTAGEVKAPVVPTATPEIAAETKTSGAPAKLNIITPTDIEATAPQVDEDKSTTEVFKL